MEGKSDGGRQEEMERRRERREGRRERRERREEGRRERREQQVFIMINTSALSILRQGKRS